MEKMRINKFLSSLGINSRREIDKLIADKRIKVNGILIENGYRVNENDEIFIDDKKVVKKERKKVYYMLNKPLKVLSSVKDERGRKTVVQFIKCDERIFPIGRLDYNTTGLILLTNDGEIYNKVIHPRSELYKEYCVEIMGEIEEKTLKRLEEGVVLENVKTLPARIKLISKGSGKSKISISIREGRNRQIRRMCESVGHPVISLRRDKVGKLELGRLRVGEYRELTVNEVKYLYSL